MTFGIDGSRATVGRLTGTERYSVELLRALADLDPPEHIKVYLNAQHKPPALRIPGEAIPIPGPRFWTLRNLALEMHRDPPDLLFVPSHVIPPIHPATVVTIHDLGYLVEPDSHDPIHRKQLEWTTKWNVSAARGIVAVSETTKTDLIQRLRVDPSAIRVIHHGISTDLQPASQAEISAIRHRYGFGDRAILAVGTIQPRKNVVRLIQAFELLAANDDSVELILCGAPGWNAEPILHRAQTSPFAQRIHRLGYLPDSELAALYSASAVFAFPSLYEGFGIPALEAMACGTPVVASNRSALPEICGNAALLIDPLNAHSIAAGIDRLMTDEQLRQKLVIKGFERAKLFRWQNCARETLAFLRTIGDNEHGK